MFTDNPLLLVQESTTINCKLTDICNDFRNSIIRAILRFDIPIPKKLDEFIHSNDHGYIAFHNINTPDVISFEMSKYAYHSMTDETVSICVEGHIHFTFGLIHEFDMKELTHTEKTNKVLYGNAKPVNNYLNVYLQK